MRFAPAVLCALVACGDRDNPPGGAPDVAPGAALVVDGMTISLAEIEEWRGYFEELDPTMGRKYATRELLDKHLIPLHLARREFAEQRAEQLERATALANAAGNYLELSRKGPLQGGFEPELPFSRNSLPLPVARWAFRPERLGQASPPIETALGYTLIAGRDLQQGSTPVHDLLDAYVVNFNSHPLPEFESWLRTAKDRIADKVTWVSDEIEGALPLWLKP